MRSLLRDIKGVFYIPDGFLDSILYEALASVHPGLFTERDEFSSSFDAVALSCAAQPTANKAENLIL